MKHPLQIDSTGLRSPAYAPASTFPEFIIRTAERIIAFLWQQVVLVKVGLPKQRDKTVESSAHCFIVGVTSGGGKGGISVNQVESLMMACWC